MVIRILSLKALEVIVVSTSFRSILADLVLAGNGVWVVRTAAMIASLCCSEGSSKAELELSCWRLHRNIRVQIIPAVYVILGSNFLSPYGGTSSRKHAGHPGQSVQLQKVNRASWTVTHVSHISLFMTIGLMRKLTPSSFTRAHLLRTRRAAVAESTPCSKSSEQLQKRCLANVRDVDAHHSSSSKLWFTSTTPSRVQEGPGGGLDYKTPDERTLKLGKSKNHCILRSYSYAIN